MNKSDLTNYKHILDQNSFAVVASILSDGSPHNTAVWFNINYEKNLLELSIEESSQKDKNFKRNKYISISIQSIENPYNYMQIRVDVIKRELDEGNKFSNFLTKKYSNGLRNQFPSSSSKLLKRNVKPRFISGWQKSSADSFYNWMKGENA